MNKKEWALLAHFFPTEDHVLLVETWFSILIAVFQQQEQNTESFILCFKSKDLFILHWTTGMVEAVVLKACIWDVLP